MNEPKPFASLSPSLLARKGGARPAMRPQIAPLHQFQSSAAACQIEEDLGWNDMGDAEGEAPVAVEPIVVEPVEAEIVQLNPHVASVTPIMAEPPEVLRQQEEVEARLTAVPARKRRERRPAASEGRRAAFTLRIDAERHLQLRLACTLAGRSAQQLVTEALDKLLSELPDVSALAAKVGKGRT